MKRSQFGKFAVLSVLMAPIVVPMAAFAHHTTAMYDVDSPIKMSGTVKAFSWGNPHSWITLTVPSAGGDTQDWLVECNSVALLERFGWTKTSVKPGDQITVTLAPHADGIKRGEAIEVITASGAPLSNAMVEP